MDLIIRYLLVREGMNKKNLILKKRYSHHLGASTFCFILQHFTDKDSYFIDSLWRVSKGK
jgi:hypothetical protein